MQLHREGHRGDKMRKFLSAAALFFGAIFLVLWLTGPPIKGPWTGESCVAFKDRLYAQRKDHSLTPAEEQDLEPCRGGD
jgi:hypothetical protein